VIEGPSVTFGCWLQTEDMDRVGSILGAWAGTAALVPKVRLGGSELSLDTASLEIYAFHLADAQGRRTVQVTGAIAGDLGSLRPRIEELHDEFKQAGFEVSTELEGCDADEESITEEFRLD